MFIFSSALLGDLGGSKQGLGALAHFKYVRSHPVPMAQSGKVRNQEIKKGLGEILLSSLLDIISKCIFPKSLVRKVLCPHLMGKAGITDIKSRENTSNFKYTGRKQTKAFGKCLKKLSFH